ncbi:hypothetical protein EVAR_10131_1 [Eumeta japonica]|uniref:Uncharacterized protein n=1 Tax=Eumeta variegata TaxID=151549 RepID=A0A4C1UD26_EUMVA|nr:hypothetical protein EVAR_10131_1 [Eumeta japonica]
MQCHRHQKHRVELRPREDRPWSFNLSEIKPLIRQAPGSGLCIVSPASPVPANTRMVSLGSATRLYTGAARVAVGVDALRRAPRRRLLAYAASLGSILIYPILFRL